MAKPIERTIVQPVMPREIDLKEPMWFVVTPANFEEFQTKIIDQEKELVFLAMTVPDYEVMAYNMQELKRYIRELKEVVVYYRKVTAPMAPKAKEERDRPTVGIYPLKKDE